MKNSKEIRNIRVLAENNDRKNGFSIYLDFSGQREYLMHHRYNRLLYTLLKDGITVADVRRMTPAQMKCHRVRGKRFSKLYNSVNHLVSVIDDYMIERTAG